MPVDIEKQEQIMRAGNAKAVAVAASLGPHVQLQVRGFEMELAAALWVARECNADTSRCMLSSALGNVVGSILRNYLYATCDGTDEWLHHADHFFKGLQDTVNNGSPVAEIMPDCVPVN